MTDFNENLEAAVNNFSNFIIFIFYFDCTFVYFKRPQLTTSFHFLSLGASLK